jgi:hypothetical protein
VPFGILFFCISLLLWNCEKEEFRGHIVLDETASNYHSRTIALDDIYDVKKYLDNLLPQSGINKTSEIEGAIFDQDHVLEVIDTLQNTNYSLRFTYPETPPGEFYNLVIGRTPEGVLKTLFVLKYTCDDNFLEDYIAHDFNMYYFKGMVKMHVYTDFFSVDAFSRTTGSCPPELDAVGDPVACEQAPIDGSDTSGGGGDGGNYGNPNSNPGNDSGGTGGFNITITDEDCLCHSTHAAGGCTHPTIVIIISGAGGMQRSVNTNTDDCPACADANTDGGIGVNEPSISSMISNIKNALDLSESESEWLHNDATTDEIILIDNYINMNTVDDTLSNEAKEFGEGLVRGNMIEDKIIDDNLEPCSKLILNDLKSLQQNDIARIIARFDAPNSAYDWEVKTGTPTNPDNVAETDWKRDSNNVAQAYEYKTIVKPSYTNQATKIAIVRTILHEMIHAHILSHIDDFQNGNTSGFLEFRELWRLIQQDLTGFNNDPEPIHHEFMASKFITPLKDALKEWDNSSQPNDQYYEDLAWGALINTDTFDHFHPDDSDSRNRIINTNNAEDTNSIQNEINPKSSPCN